MSAPTPAGPAGPAGPAPPAPPADLAAQVERALAEDIGGGDLTAALIPAAAYGRATVITREPAIICGRPYVDAAFKRLDPQVQLHWQIEEGANAHAGERLLEVAGSARALLTAERTALNFLQLLSATATAAHRYASLIEGTGCRVLDTRKTIPGLRSAQKYAVRIGGGQNHRIGLYDGVLIKENHIMAAGSITAAVAHSRALYAHARVEVEVENIEQLREAIAVGADVAMLDNFSPAQLREAVAFNRACARPVKLEASGGVTEDSVRTIAETGVDYVSVGALTKNITAVDLSMRFEWGPQE